VPELRDVRVVVLVDPDLPHALGDRVGFGDRLEPLDTNIRREVERDAAHPRHEEDRRPLDQAADVAVAVRRVGDARADGDLARWARVELVRRSPGLADPQTAIVVLVRARDRLPAVVVPPLVTAAENHVPVAAAAIAEAVEVPPPLARVVPVGPGVTARSEERDRLARRHDSARHPLLAREDAADEGAREQDRLHVAPGGRL